MPSPGPESSAASCSRWLHRHICRSAGVDAGSILAARAAAWGLPSSCRMVMGCLDQYAGAIGVGNVAPGGVSETTGTVLALVRCAERMATGPAPFFQGPAWAADRFYRMSFGSVSANLLERYRDSLPDPPSYEELDAWAAAVPPGSEGLRLRPDAAIVAIEDAFLGWSSRHGRGHAVRCILEAVAQALEGHVRTLCGPRLPSEIRCAGGGARSDLWLQIKANRLGVPMTAMDCLEPTSLGAAILAGQALGWGDTETLARQWARPRKTFEPRTRPNGGLQA